MNIVADFHKLARLDGERLGGERLGEPAFDGAEG